jgi:large subunit ribosomal protein L21
MLVTNAKGMSPGYFASSKPRKSLGKKFGANMYAIFESGGKQHRVVEGETLKLEKIEVATGGTVEFDKVYLVAIGDDVKIGAPIVAGAKVIAEVIAQGRADKVKIIKFRRRKHHMKRQGHRQWFTEVKITAIKA